MKTSMDRAEPEVPFRPYRLRIDLETQEEAVAFACLLVCWDEQRNCSHLREVRKLADELRDRFRTLPIV